MHAKVVRWQKAARRKVVKTAVQIVLSVKKCQRGSKFFTLHSSLFLLPLHPVLKMVPWMSGLVYGLQNRPRRFESARHLARIPSLSVGDFFYSPLKRSPISAISSSSNHLERRFLAFSWISGSISVQTFFRT